MGCRRNPSDRPRQGARPRPFPRRQPRFPTTLDADPGDRRAAPSCPPDSWATLTCTRRSLCTSRLADLDRPCRHPRALPPAQVAQNSVPCRSSPFWEQILDPDRYDAGADAHRDLYALLGVPWGTAGSELKSAWRASLKKAHPNIGGSGAEVIEVQWAWEVLSNETSRHRYENSCRVRPNPHQGRASRSTDQASTCLGTDAWGQMCHRAPIVGGSRCVLHLTQSDEEADANRSRFARSYFCAGRTKQGFQCMNAVRAGQTLCWLHGGKSPNSSHQGTNGPSDRRGWGCHHCEYKPRLQASLGCWDHSTESEQIASVQGVTPGKCASLTQRGMPCQKGRFLDYPVCDSHTTLGLLRNVGPQPYSREPSGSAPNSSGRSEPPKQSKAQENPKPAAHKTVKRPTPEEETKPVVSGDGLSSWTARLFYLMLLLGVLVVIFR